ncbi:hypothetical protein B0A53_03672 [Rhodotorula sp. CCFEE 5036]|nr:hypothetical protein B0A53_03672 [Rhodotorula sp. CCFEE 5036]
MGSNPSPRARVVPLKPYLGLKARLSLSWLSQHVFALLLVLITLAYLLSAIPSLVRDAKQSLGAACQGVQGAANVAVSMPHYMAAGVNELNANAINALTHGAGTALDLLLQALQAIVLFMIDMYRSLYLCLLDLAVHGSITVLVRGIEEAQEFVTEAMQGLRTTIQAAVGGVNSGLEHTLGLIDKLPGVNIDVPQIDIPQLSALENVTLPNTLIDALENLNSTIPTLDEVRSSLDSLISVPVDQLRLSINSTMRDSTISVELLPVPAKETVQLCDRLDTSWIDDVGTDLAHFVKVAIGLVVLAMVLFMTANALWEYYSYRVFIGGVDASREAWLRDLLILGSDLDAAAPLQNPAFRTVSVDETLSRTNLLSFLNASSHPTLFKHLSRLSSLLSLDRTTNANAKANLIWFLSYIAHPYAWGFLLFGLVGLVVVQIQIAVLDGPVRAVTEQRAEQGASDFSGSVVEALQGTMRNASLQWANGTNAVIGRVESGINENLFSWVNTTTVTLNSTMNGFYDEVSDTITNVFSGTVLQDPALGLIYCLIGSKVDALSSALTWIHDHAHLSLPTVSPSILLLSPNRTDDLTASLTDPESSISAPSIANKMIDAYLRSLEQQRMGFFVAIGIWALVFLMGLIGAWWRAIGQNRWRHWRGATARNGSGGGPQAPARDGAEKADFTSLHLGSFPDLLDTNANSGNGEKNLGAGSPAGVDQGNSVSPSSRSWASLVDFFKATEPAARSSEAVESAASPPPPPETRLRPLALPTLPTLRTRGAKDRLRPQQRQRWERWRSKEESDLVLLRDESRSKLGRTGALRSLRRITGPTVSARWTTFHPRRTFLTLRICPTTACGHHVHALRYRHNLGI